MDYNRKKTIDDNENQLNSYKKNEKKNEIFEENWIHRDTKLTNFGFSVMSIIFSGKWSKDKRIKTIKVEPKEEEVELGLYTALPIAYPMGHS